MKKILPSIFLSILICLGSGADEKTKISTMIFVKGNAAVSSFYICDHEVTQAEYSAMMGQNPSQYYGDNKPVETVTWYDAVEYCNRRSKKEGLTPCYKIDKSKEDPNNHNEYDQQRWLVTWDRSANGYRLPTDSEWEWAAKGGEKSKKYTYSGSNKLADVAWFYENSENTTNDVKTKRPNELGIYDMSGNVWEWCWDWYEDNPKKSGKDYAGASSGEYRVTRGGCWSVVPTECKVTNRNNDMPDEADDLLGFRVVRNY